MNEQQHCTQLITQILKYANSCVTKFKMVGNECYMSKNMAEFIEKYGRPFFFNKPSIPSNEYGTLNATIKVFINETLEDHQFIVGVAGTDNKIEFELRKN